MIRFVPMPIITPELIWRFWDKVQKTDYCWLWTGSKLKAGYGLLGGGDRKVYVATRISYTIHFNKDPGNLEVCHDCQNASCVRPDHLYLDDHQGNMKFAGINGRIKVEDDLNPSAKLTLSEVLEIQEIGYSISLSNQARKYSVTPSTIQAVLERRTWNHV